MSSASNLFTHCPPARVPKCQEQMQNHSEEVGVPPEHCMPMVLYHAGRHSGPEMSETLSPTSRRAQLNKRMAQITIRKYENWERGIKKKSTVMNLKEGLMSLD